jgi:hypothetical protein
LIQILVLMAAATFSNVRVAEASDFCQTSVNSLGGFDPASGAVTLCQNNLSEHHANESRLEVLKHELTHVVQHRLGRGDNSLLPEQLLTPLVRQLMPSDEVMAVLMDYPRADVSGELEARLIGRYLPSEAIALGLMLTRDGNNRVVR